MTEEERPNLSLGTPPPGLKLKAQKSNRGLLFTVLLIQLIILIILFLYHPKGPASSSWEERSEGVDDPKTVALKLEEKSLYTSAAEAWDRFLSAFPEAADRSQILYRMGTLYMKAREYEKAASAFVRAELASKNHEELGTRIGPKMVECLRNLGLYGEVGRELSRRVEIGGEETGRGKVLATFAGEALTEADLDSMIERRVDQILAMQGGMSNEEQRAAFLKQMKAPKMRQQVFQEILQSELFSRRAREMKLDQEEEYLTAKEIMEQGLLASRFLKGALDKIQPTEVDLETYYKAFRGDYKEPEKVEALLIQLKPGEDSAPLLESIGSAEDFEELAKERESEEGDTEPAPWEIVKGEYHSKLGYDTEPLFELKEGEWTRSPIERGEDRFLALIQKKNPARTPGLSEVRERVLGDYMQRKQQEMIQEIFRDLMARYDVKLLSPPEETGAEGKEESKEGNGSHDPE